MKARTNLQITQTHRMNLSLGLQTALHVLRADAAALIRYLEEQAAETPALVLRPVFPGAGDWLPRWSGVLPHSGPDEVATLAAHGPSLMAHVVSAIPALVSGERDRKIALALADALEPSGWLGRRLEDIAAELGLSVDAVSPVLSRLHRIDPPGLFARDLAECLRLQAIDAEVTDPILTTMLSRLDLVASGDWATLARAAQTSEAEILVRFRLIRSFNPKPGASFAAIASPLREPDLIARQGEGGWQITLNHSALPALTIDPDASGAARAREVIRLVETRNTTLLNVAQAILSHQRAALDVGPSALRPLTMQSLAETIGLHKSTVSRVVAGAAVDTPHGTWWLRRLFSSDMGADTAAAALHARLARLVATEDAAQPMSDDALAQALCTDGAALARRTVAKYRAELRIPPAHRRRLKP
ncbi:MAG: RNA polymerase sigma-54 factor [Pseudotabrizicola sp.]|uniref:RNA polymerase factor sigma-54 n=1 Tax=Pseudotabrizicola sp. TaxID=2939647 RepID=UPI002730C30E|nr:RNA polymerase sigma-54 factor [Pseudotabrizicola sp.]MDP2082171.1 RNA polymerase sigma-54 factor [Pseudotabrizicola sp.]MDZ7573210.1 RNA polymerase sigma-54 factor [Pseudotabrizicola sp.]